MNDQRIWKGKRKDYDRLLAIIEKNCPNGCAQGTNPAPDKCPVHSILADQKLLSGLEFEADSADLRITQEWHVRNRKDDAA